MLKNWKYRLTKEWTLMRMIRLGLAILMFAEAWKNGEILFAGLGGILLFQTLLNVGCCGSGACDINHSQTSGKSVSKETKEVIFEEINK